MSELYAPNQQVVRADGSGPAEEGEGASGGPVPEQVAEMSVENAELDEFTKDELLEYARSIGASPANAAMSKAELRESIEAQQS